MSTEPMQTWLKEIIENHEYSASERNDFDGGVQFMAECCLNRMKGGEFDTPQPECTKPVPLTPEERKLYRDYAAKMRAEREEREAKREEERKNPHGLNPGQWAEIKQYVADHEDDPDLSTDLQ